MFVSVYWNGVKIFITEIRGSGKKMKQKNCKYYQYIQFIVPQ